jgi:ADP-ribose pyrophosphatase
MQELEPWRVINSEVLLDKPPWLRVVRERVELPNGVIIDDYLLAPGRDYAMVVAIDDDDGVLLVRQYKHGLGRVITEFPAGYLDGDEEPLQAAKRELMEETGVAAETWTALGSFCLSPNRGGTAAHFFLARGLTHERDPRLDATEDLVTFIARRAAIDDMLTNGELPTVACAAIWGLATARLRVG